jgi:anti-sigma B factor antagonist
MLSFPLNRLARIGGTMAVQDHLQIAVSHEDDRVVLSLNGELDMASAPLLERAIEDMEPGDGPMVVLDLQRLEFIDSTGLRFILSARRRCGERGQELAVTRGSQQVERLLSVTGMSEHLHQVPAAGELGAS